GNISLAMSINTRERLLQRDLPWYTDLWDNPNTTSGAFFFTPRPGVSGLALPANGFCETRPEGCVLTAYFAGANPPVPNTTGTVYINQDGSLFTTGGNVAEVGGADFWQPWPERDNNINAYWKRTATGALSAVNALT